MSRVFKNNSSKQVVVMQVWNIEMIGESWWWLQGIHLTIFMFVCLKIFMIKTNDLIVYIARRVVEPRF